MFAVVGQRQHQAFGLGPCIAVPQDWRATRPGREVVDRGCCGSDKGR
jgi:hypothetical protein